MRPPRWAIAGPALLLCTLAGAPIAARPAASAQSTQAQPSKPQATPPAAKPTPTPAPQKVQLPTAGPVLGAAYMGDLDGMVKRRVIRAGVVYSKTHYFIDKGVQRGAAYEALKLFEDQINTKYKTGNLKIHVVFVPL